MTEIDLTIPDFLKRSKGEKPAVYKEPAAVTPKLTEQEENEQLVRRIADRRWRKWSAIEEVRRLGLKRIPHRPRLSTFIKQARAELAAKEKAWAERRRAG